ncbi:hypothetical protein CEXT_749061 [Caerostris extrusa]|uniref:Uncharacterized protein n=1 Tax=Caerostris extrusa TaxID=172846 RepID=A0AAV4P5B1_CAEEX|nr:hypothetical protein CEXT_749061 [Caerostris extrusa]
MSPETEMESSDLIHQVMNDDLKLSSILGILLKDEVSRTRDHHLSSKCGRTFICTEPETTIYPASAGARLSVQNQRLPPILQVYLYRTRDHHLSCKCGRTFICTKPEITTCPPSEGVSLSVQNQRPTSILKCGRKFICTAPETTIYPPRWATNFPTNWNQHKTFIRPYDITSFLPAVISIENPPSWNGLFQSGPVS